jgi:hypothetical protein
VNLENQVIELIRQVAELKSQVEILLRVFYGMAGLFAVQIVAGLWRVIKQKK